MQSGHSEKAPGKQNGRLICAKNLVGGMEVVRGRVEEGRGWNGGVGLGGVIVICYRSVVGVTDNRYSRVTPYAIIHKGRNRF